MDEKSQFWASGTIRDLLEDVRPGPAPEAEDHEIDYQAWFITRRPKEIASTAELQAKLEETFHKAGCEMFVAPEARSEPEAKMDVGKVIDQGVQAVFEREWMVRTDALGGEIGPL